nr:M48 family metallopeptidase [Thalassotalea piscium]
MAVLTLSACTKSSTGRNQIMLFSDNELNKMGAQSFDEMKQSQKISQDTLLNNYVYCVADKITANVPADVHKGAWEVIVFDSKQVNAFALPGGKIGVYTGILNVAENQHQLAAIIGHEVGHVIEHHSNERMSANFASQIAVSSAQVLLAANNVENKGLWMAGLGLGVQYGLIMPYSRSHESEADIIGQNLMAKSGFLPKGAITLWENMAKVSKGAPPEFLSTHPSNSTRISDLTRNLPKAQQYYSSSNTPNCVKPNK